MNKTKSNWGIDLVGRKMWYGPWPTDVNDKYRNPTDIEKEEVYGISGEAINETLLYFEKSGGNTKKLIKLLNDHVIDDRFFIDRKKLLDKTRWYTNEYYFYFIMFTKKVIGDYNWHFTKGDNVQLSEYHKIYEQGFLKFLPYGENVKDTTNSIPFAFIKHYTSKGYNVNVIFEWIDALTKEKTPINYKNDVSKLDNYLICSEFIQYIYLFCKIISNKNSLMELVHEGFESYHLGGLSYVPEAMLKKIITFFVKKSTNVFDIEIIYNKKNSIQFFLKQSKKAKSKYSIYAKSCNKSTNSLTIAAIQEVIKKILKLDNLPEIKDLTGISTPYCIFKLNWEKRISNIPYLQIMICNTSALMGLLLNHFIKWNYYLFIIILFIPVNIILILLRKIKIEKHKKNIAEEHIIKISEDDSKRLEKAEELSNELMLEKKLLEEKVIERTSKLAEANEKLKVLDKTKTNFFANVSHELRTPLTLILGPLEMILSGKYGKTFRYSDEKIKIMLYNGTKLLKLINNLLDFTKIEVGRMSLKKQKTDILKLLKFYASTVESLAENRGMKIVFNNSLKKSNKKNFIVNIDINLLEKAFFNLISNALKFTNHKGNITVELKDTLNDFSISIIDDGIGIPENKLESIFERFSQIDDSTSRKYEGTGIGLSLTKEIIEIMGGNITVESKPGKGSKFTMIFPIDTENIDDENYEVKNINEVKSYLLSDLKTSIKGKNDQHKNKNNKKDKKILIVEDNNDMRIYLKSILKNQYNVLLAEDGKQGFQMTKNENPDLILADIMMPEMDGYEMTGLIKSFDKHKGIPIILLTAKADMFMKLEGFEKGADDYIVKPFNAKELLSRIKAHIEMKNLRDELIKQKKELEETINEKIIMQKQLEESEKRFREMAENLPISIVEIDLNKKINYLNQYTKKLFNLDYNDLLYEIKILDYVKPEEKDKLNSNFKKLFNGEDVGLYETKFIAKNNDVISVLIKSNPIYKENRITGIRSTIFEIQPEMNLTLLPDDDFYKKYKITNRERDVLVNILKGYRNKDIGEKLFLSEIAIKKYVSNIYGKVEVKNRSELIKKIAGY